MNLNRLFGPKAPPRGWDPDSRDPLVARIATAAGDDPSLAGRVRRRRSLVLQEFARQNAEPLPRRWTFRPRLAPALVIGLILATLAVGGVAAIGPGQPMYPLRLMAEEFMLPAPLADRLAAQLDRLDLRLDEAAGALAASDDAAARAALAAYGQIASDVMAIAPPDEAVANALQVRITAQIERLRMFRTSARQARDEALTAANGIVAWLMGGQDDNHGPRPGPTASPQASPSAESTPRGTPPLTPHPSGGSDGPNATPHPGGSGDSPRSSGPTPSPGLHQPTASPGNGE
jgi:hypothetical protein